MEELTVDNFRTHLLIFNYSLYPNIAGLLDFENISDMPRVPPFSGLELKLRTSVQRCFSHTMCLDSLLLTLSQKDLYFRTTLTLT